MNFFKSRGSEYDDPSEKDDFFEKELEEEAPRVKPPRTPDPTPDDPNYWENADSDWGQIHPRSQWRIWGWVLAAMAGAGVLIGTYIYLFTPYEREAVQYGFVEKISYRGHLLKTFEGTVIPYREMMDTSRVYDRDFVFSAANEKVATRIKFLEKSGLPVRLEYSVYRVRLPWRGESNIIVTAADSVPPEVTLIR